MRFSKTEVTSNIKRLRATKIKVNRARSAEAKRIFLPREIETFYESRWKRERTRSILVAADFLFSCVEKGVAVEKERGKQRQRRRRGQEDGFIYLSRRSSLYFTAP